MIKLTINRGVLYLDSAENDTSIQDDEYRTKRHRFWHYEPPYDKYESWYNLDNSAHSYIKQNRDSVIHGAQEFAAQTHLPTALALGFGEDLLKWGYDQINDSIFSFQGSFEELLRIYDPREFIERDNVDSYYSELSPKFGSSYIKRMELLNDEIKRLEGKSKDLKLWSVYHINDINRSPVTSLLFADVHSALDDHLKQLQDIKSAFYDEYSVKTAEYYNQTGRNVTVDGLMQEAREVFMMALDPLKSFSSELDQMRTLFLPDSYLLRDIDGYDNVPTIRIVVNRKYPVEDFLSPDLIDSSEWNEIENQYNALLKRSSNVTTMTAAQNWQQQNAALAEYVDELQHHNEVIKVTQADWNALKVKVEDFESPDLIDEEDWAEADEQFQRLRNSTKKTIPLAQQLAAEFTSVGHSLSNLSIIASSLNLPGAELFGITGSGALNIAAGLNNWNFLDTKDNVSFLDYAAVGSQIATSLLSTFDNLFGRFGLFGSASYDSAHVSGWMGGLGVNDQSVITQKEYNAHYIPFSTYINNDMDVAPYNNSNKSHYLSNETLDRCKAAA